MEGQHRSKRGAKNEAARNLLKELAAGEEAPSKVYSWYYYYSTVLLLYFFVPFLGYYYYCFYYIYLFIYISILSRYCFFCELARATD